jgi:hypothetical protein
MHIARVALFTSLSLLTVAGSWAATTSIPASRDTSIYQNSPNNSAGGAAGIFVGTNGQGAPRRGMIKFDVPGIVPAGARITAAHLRMYLGNAPNLTPLRTIGLHQLNVDWGEGGAGSSNPAIGGGGNGFAAGAGDATWNERFFGSASWASPGATGNFNPVASATATAGEALDSPFFWLSTPGLVSDVRGWLDAPATNFGWALVNTNETSPQTVRVFYSSEATQTSTGAPLDPTWRPTLTVTYLIPEPASVLLLILVTACYFAIRREGNNWRECS